MIGERLGQQTRARSSASAIDVRRGEMRRSRLLPKFVGCQNLDVRPVLENLEQQLAVVPVRQLERIATIAAERRALLRMPHFGADPARPLRGKAQLRPP